MKIQTYRRKDKAAYSKLQEFLADLAKTPGLEVPIMFDIFSGETAQIERLTTLAARKTNFLDQFNYQEIRVLIEDDTPITLGTKQIKGQPRDVQIKKSSENHFSTRRWDWRPVGDQQIEVRVKWDTAPTERVHVTFSVWGD